MLVIENLSAGSMTRVHHDFGEGMQKESILPVSSDVNFVSDKFPDYKIGSNNIIIELEEDPKAPSLKEIVAKETALLLDQQKRLSVRDLTKKFENGLATADKLSDEDKWKEIASLDRHVLLKKLRDVLESLRGRVAGRNMDDADEAISMVEALAVQLTQREGELLHEKAEVTKLANLLKQALEDAKKAVEEERALARTEIENARAAMQRVEQALQEEHQNPRNGEIEDLDELRKEVQEARRIKMLHQPSRVMDMEYELKELRIQHSKKSLYCIQLKQELDKNKRLEENRSNLYGIEGPEYLGSYMHIVPRTNASPNIHNCSIQWYRVTPEGNKKELISGATKPIYAPEPFDVGRLLLAEIVLNDERIILTTGAIDPAAGLGSYVESLLRKGDNEFNVVVVQMNGHDHPSESVHVFHVGKLRIELRKGRSTKAKESFSTSMQLCGVRGGGNAAAQSVFWQARRGLSFILAFESIRERNAAIMLARRCAFDCSIVLGGPDDRSSVGT